jgi:transcriptional regulator with XRE-family HTH domain
MTNVRRLRQLTGLPQQKFAERVGMSFGALRNHESGAVANEEAYSLLAYLREARSEARIQAIRNKPQAVRELEELALVFQEQLLTCLRTTHAELQGLLRVVSPFVPPGVGLRAAEQDIKDIRGIWG